MAVGARGQNKTVAVEMLRPCLGNIVVGALPLMSVEDFVTVEAVG